MKQINLSLLTAASLLFLAASNFSCKKEITTEPQFPEEAGVAPGEMPIDPGFAENNMVIYWNEKANIVLDAPMNPPTQARYFAIIQIAVHDALNSIRPKFERYALLNERNQFASPDAAVTSAAYWAMKGLNRQGFPIDTWYNESLATIPDGESKELGITLGKHAADAIIAKRSTDNFAQANQQLALPDGINPGEYRSTLPYSDPGMPKIKALPFWGTLMTPFAVQSNDQFRPGAPYPVNSLQYETDYDEVKAKGARVGHTRTADEDEIGRFWIVRPSSAWNQFVRKMIAEKKIDAWKTARLFALLHTAMMDGITSGFESAYHYFYWRPETAIRMTDNGNPNTTGDPTWLPSFTELPPINGYSPPFPAYPNVQADFGGAAAEVLKLFFESDIISVDQTSPTTPGIIRHYSSISQAARDHSLARLYAGHCFRSACMEGEEQGRQIGNYVFNHCFRESGD